MRMLVAAALVLAAIGSAEAQSPAQAGTAVPNPAVIDPTLPAAPNRPIVDGHHVQPRPSGDEPRAPDPEIGTLLKNDPDQGTKVVAHDIYGHPLEPNKPPTDRAEKPDQLH